MKKILLIPIVVASLFLLSCKEEEPVWIGDDVEPIIGLQWVDPGDGTDIGFGPRFSIYGCAYEIHIPPQASEYSFVANNVDSLVLGGIQVAIADTPTITGPDADVGIWSTKNRRTYKSQWIDIFVTKLDEKQEHIRVIVKEPETTKYPVWIAFGYRDYALIDVDMLRVPNGLTIRFDR